MELLTDFLWEKGSAGNVNEDSLTIQQIRCKRTICCMAMVCDGIGGLSMGEYASGYVTEEFIKWFYAYAPKICMERKSSIYIKRAVGREFYRIYKGMKETADKNKCQMGTTVTLCLIFGRKGYLFHLGDSRLYRISKKGVVCRLTQIHENNRILTKALSSFSFQTPDILTFPIKRKEGYLLCSDGLWRYLNHERIKECFCIRELTKEEEIQRRLKELGNMVVRMGAKDDISAIYIQTE